MFGFLAPGTCDLSYRSIYARACQHLRQHHGLFALRYHSYESAFLFAVAADSSPSIQAAIPRRSCCRLRGIPSWKTAPDRGVGQFCAAVSMLLAKIKLDDDIHDERSWKARIGRRWLRRPLHEAERYLATLDPQFTRRVQKFLDRHSALESGSRPIALREYTAPTADAFSYVFGMMARLSEMQSHGESLSTLGRFVGTAIIAYDCAVDWRRDQRVGAFNPLNDVDEVANAFRLSRWAIEQATHVCQSDFGIDSASAQILLGVAERLLRLEQPSHACVAGKETVDALLHPDADKRHVYLYSGCEGACCVCCCLFCCGAISSACTNEKTVHVVHHRGCG